jgi:hypothetical protein
VVAENMLGLLVVAGAAHVPTYSTDGNQCIKPPRDHTTSQVVYIRAEPESSSGLEIHCTAQKCPFAYADNEQIDWDATFKKQYDPSTFRLFVGCAGCNSEDPITIEPLVVQYETATLEPFTTTAYNGLTGVKKTFDSALINPAVCPNEHWGIRLVTFANASTMYWGAVVGLGARLALPPLPHTNTQTHKHAQASASPHASSWSFPRS